MDGRLRSGWLSRSADYTCRMRLRTGPLNRAVALLLCTFLCVPASATSDDQVEPPKIDLRLAALPQLLPPTATIPDIPWRPPAPPPDTKTPFAPKFLSGNNIFAGEKEYWLADAVADTERRWPRRFSDPLVNHYLTDVTQNLGRYSHEPTKHYEIGVVDTGAANAFTAGGGRIYITRGVLRQVNNEDELAGVIAHEIGHDNFHHAGRTATRQLFWVAGIQEVKSYADTQAAVKKLLAAYDPERSPFPEMGEAVSGIGRADEQSADKAAFYFLHKAGYNSLALAEFLERAPDPTEEYLKSEAGAAWPVFWTLSLLFDSHPPAGMRVAALRWESNLIGTAPNNTHADLGAFEATRIRLKYPDEEDARKAREVREKKKGTKRDN
jgi:predicted Zn-dependent protease